MFKKQKIKIYLLLPIAYFAIILASYFLLLASVSAQAQKPEITLTWSTNSYIPFDYPAKALPTKDSSIEVVAFLESSSVNPEALYYYWYLDERLQRNKSGLGKLTFKFSATNEAGQSHRVKLWLKGAKDSSILEKTIEIKIVAPQIQVKGPISLKTGKGGNFVAIPYFFSIKNINELNYQWNFGGKEALIVDLKNPNLLILKTEQTSRIITQNLKATAGNKNNPSQRAESNLKITLIP